jgi:hypothetical protein
LLDKIPEERHAEAVALFRMKLRAEQIAALECRGECV